jgi:hypothetical protein
MACYEGHHLLAVYPGMFSLVLSLT